MPTMHHLQAEAADSLPVSHHFYCALYGPRLDHCTGKSHESDKKSGLKENNKTKSKNTLSWSSPPPRVPW